MDMRCLLVHVKMGGNHVLPAECGLQPLDAVAAPFVKSSVFLYVHHVLMCSRQNHSDYTDLVMCNLPLDACRVQPVGNRFIPAMNAIGVFYKYLFRCVLVGSAFLGMILLSIWSDCTVSDEPFAFFMSNEKYPM